MKRAKMHKSMFIFLINLIVSQSFSQSYYFPYNLSRDPVEDKSQFLYSLNYLQNNNKSEFESVLKMDSLISFWDAQSRSKWTFTYDTNDKIIEQKEYYFYDDEYELWNRITYTYNEEGKIILKYEESWNVDFWKESMRETFTYNADGLLDTHLSEFYTAQGWTNAHRVTYYYDSDGNSIMLLSERWEENHWVNSSRTSTEYFSSGVRDCSLFEKWEGDEWIYFLHSTFNYDEEWKLIQTIGRSWSDNEWVNLARATFKYNNTADNIARILELWINDNWEYDSQITYKYNSEHYITSALSEYWQNGEWISDIGGITIENPDGFFIALLTTKILIYYDSATDIDQADDSPKDYALITNYPNPFNPETYIIYYVPVDEFIKLTIYNSKGQKVKTLVDDYKRKGRHQIKFNADNLSSGIYICRLEGQLFYYSKKILLLK